jgi:tetratricopeptide (TPR) repeat protein
MGGRAQPNLKGSVRLGNYLRRLRNGYGYSLRRVEERARAEGGEIDNSQLSRYEKGVCYPSFDKLRILASVFNVPIQAFADVVDLESCEHLRPDSGDPAELLEEGKEALKSGDAALAFACYEKALDLIGQSRSNAGFRRQAGRVRVGLALALHGLGKLSLAEQELRNALRGADRLHGSLKVQAVLNLANVHADQGDLFLAEMEAEKALRFATDQELDVLSARSLHTLGRVLADQGEDLAAIEKYRDAAALYERCGDTYEAARIRVNIGGCYVSLGKSREGIRLLRAALVEARNGGFRRQQARAWSYLGEAYYRLGDRPRAMKCLRESDSLAGSGERFADLMFVNAFYEWKMAGEEGNPTREKIAFGRLKALRSGLERKFPEVEAFDAHVERGRANA